MIDILTRDTANPAAIKPILIQATNELLDFEHIEVFVKYYENGNIIEQKVAYDVKNGYIEKSNNFIKPQAKPINFSTSFGKLQQRKPKQKRIFEEYDLLDHTKINLNCFNINNIDISSYKDDEFYFCKNRDGMKPLIEWKENKYTMGHLIQILTGDNTIYVQGSSCFSYENEKLNDRWCRLNLRS